MATRRTKTVLGRAAVGITVVALAAVGLLGYRAAAGDRSSTDRYRTVTAAAGTVTQVLSLSGTVHHVTQAGVSFPTIGRIVAVNVRAGDTVTAGQALASIDTTPLQNAVLAADATYKNAVAQYETDQSSYASSSTTTSATRAATTARPTGTTTGFPSGGTGTPGGGSSGGDATDAAVKAAEDALAALKVGIAAVDSALPTFIAECVPLIPTTTAVPGATVTQTVTQTATVTQTVTHTATVTETATVTAPAPSASVTVTPVSVKPASVTVKAAATSGTASTTASTSASTTASGSASSTASSTPTSSGSTASSLPAACQAAIDTLTASSKTLPDQMTAATLAMNAALKALNAKAAALNAQASALASATSGGSGSSSSPQNQASVLSSTNSALQAAAAAAVGNASSRTGAGTVTEATLIMDKANIEATRISLAEAQDQLSQATITSPIAGKVASIPFIVGQQASPTASAVVIGSGAIEVTVPVPLAKRPQVATNQTATVTSSVGGTSLTGTISRISLLPTSTGVSLAAAGTTGAAAAAAAGATSTTSTTYPTVITVPSGGDLLPEGSRVQATITTKTVEAKVVLPASAVTPTGATSATVQVLNGSTVTLTRVVMGAVGDAYVEIVSGVTAGETVVIADTTIPIAAASIPTGRPTAAQQTGGGFDPAQGGGVPPTGDAAPTR